MLDGPTAIGENAFQQYFSDSNFLGKNILTHRILESGREKHDLALHRRKLTLDPPIPQVALAIAGKNRLGVEIIQA